MINRLLLITLSVLMGGLYLFSGYSKLYPIEPFEFTFVDSGVAGWALSPFLARSIIGLEFVLGLLFLFNIATRGLTSKISIGLLSFFTLYLTWLLIKNGNESNCGCFGEMVRMTPLESIIKNIVLIVLSYLLLKKGEELDLKRLRLPLIAFAFVISFGMPYILNPIDLNYSESYLSTKEDQYMLPLDTLINNGYVHKVPEDIKNGKHIIAFLSSTCPHCKIGATKLRIMKDKNEKLPVFFVINGDEKEIDSFIKKTGSASVPWTRLGERPFVYLAGLRLPAIFLINNQKVELEVNYFSLDQQKIEEWLNKP